MKSLLTLMTIMAIATTSAQSGKASTVRTTFGRETSVSIEIKADKSIIWTLLTNASDYPRWNSTVISMDGEIEQGNKIRLKSTLDTSRTFTLKVKEYEPESRMVWGDGKGNRIYTLSENPHGTVTFSMTEKIGGLMFPMYAKYIPPFDESFEQFAANLKKEAEIIQNEKN